MPTSTLNTRQVAALWETAAREARSAVEAVHAEARHHRFELLVLGATLGFLLIVVLCALAALSI